MLTSNENLYYNYRIKEITREIKQAALLREVLRAEAQKPSFYKNLMLVVAKQLVQMGSRLEQRYTFKRNLECCA